ncbi:MAG: type II secretion system protein [bacterium]
MKISKQYLSRGFTLIEILVVIGIIAVLASIVIIAINPAKQFAQARNTQRQSNIEAILNGIGQRMADNRGVFQGSFSNNTYSCPSLPTTTPAFITNGTATSGQVDLSCLIPTYISVFPTDPITASGTNTGYTVVVDGSGRVQVCAPASTTETSIPDSSANAICIKR